MFRVESWPEEKEYGVAVSSSLGAISPVRPIEVLVLVPTFIVRYCCWFQLMVDGKFVRAPSETDKYPLWTGSLQSPLA